MEKRAREESESEKRGVLILLAYGLKKNAIRKKEYGVGELNYFKRRNSTSLRSVASVSVWFRKKDRARNETRAKLLVPFFARSLTLVLRSSCSLLLNRTETLAPQAIIRPNTLTELFINIFLDISEAMISDVFVRTALHRHIFFALFS